MSKSKSKSKTKKPAKRRVFGASRPIGPEDVRVGGYVTIVRTMHELIPDDCDWKADLEPIRITLLSTCAGWPFKVVAVSLPFVMVTDAQRGHYTIDLRRHQLARVASRYGRATFKSVSRQRKGKLC